MPNNETLYSQMLAATKAYEEKQAKVDAEERKKREKEAEERRRTQAMLRSTSSYIDQVGKSLDDTVTQVHDMMPQRPTTKKPTSMMPSVGKVEMGAPTINNTEEDPLSKSIVDSYSKQDKRVAEATEDKSWWEKGIEYVEKALNPTQFAARTVANWIHEQNNTPTSTWEERLSHTVEDAINQLPQDKDGKYIFNGASYSRDLLTPLVEDYAKEVLHPYMIATDTHYQDNYAQSLGYADRNAMFEAYKKPLEEMRAELKEEQTEANKEAFDYYAENPTYDGGDSYIATLMGNKMAAKTNGIQAIDDAIDMINAMQKGTLASGFKEGFNLDDFASLGVVGLVSDIKLLSVYNKLKDGEELTPTEERMLKISQITEELSMYKDANTTTMQSIGEGLGTTAEALPQFAPVMGVATKVANLGKVGVRAGVNLTKRAVREGVAKGVMEGLKQTGRVGKNVAINIAKANVGGLVVAPLQTGTYTKYLENRQNQFSFKDGKLIYTPNAAWKDMYTAIVDQMNEVSSEILGAGIGKVTDFTFKGLGKVFGLDKAINGISSKVGLGASYDKIFGVKKGAAFRAMERAVGYAGDPVAEAFSEIYGDISSNIMKMGITDAEGNSVSDFSMLSDPKYWATNLAVAGVFGLTTTMANTARNIPVYSKISDLGKVKRKAINNIADKGLADALRMTGVDMDINASAQRLADYMAQRNSSTEGKLPRITQKDIAHAMDYIRAEATQQVMLGVNEQNKDLAKFARVSADIENRAYRGEKGDVETTYIVEGVLEDGSKVNVISGNIEETPSVVVEVPLEDGTNVEVESKSGETESEGDILMVMDEQGKIMPMAKSKVTITHRGKVSDKVAWEYQNMFNTQSLMLEVSSDISTFEALEAPTEKDVNTLMEKMGIAQPEMHDEVTLVDGRKGLFVGWGAEGKMDVEVQSQDGSIELLSVPFFQILSSMSHYAEAQRLYFGIKTVNMAENELEAEERKAEAVGSSTTNAEVNGIAKGAIVNTPNGVAQVVAIDGDKVTVDYAYKDSAGKAELMDTEEVSLSDISEATETTTPNAEVVPEAGVEVTTEVTAPEAPAAEAVESTEDVEAAQNEVAGIEKIPMTEDGNIDFDAIDDPKLFADLYKKEAGSVEAAIADVTEARNATEAKMQESIAKGKKSTSMNERNANRKEREALAQRVAFYDSVLNELAPKEAVAEDTQTENVEPAATEPAATTEARETESANSTPEKAAEKKTGVIENKHSENINEALLKTIDRIAKMLGVTVEFQPVVMEDGRRVNGMIKDGHVIMATEVASQAPSWLAGHEFLHRMKELAPEQYEKFVQSVKDFMGEDLWKRRMDAQRALYIKNKFFEKAKDDDLMTEECAADFLGDMVEQADAFNEYLDSIQNEPVVLRFIHRAIDAIKRVLTGKKKSRLAKMQEQVNALITAAEKANAEGVNVDAQTPIEVIESAERLEEKGGVVDVQRGDAKFALADVLSVSEQEQAIQDLMRVTGRSRATVHKYIKAEQSLARFILSGDNAAYLDYEADDSVPSIWENSDYPQGTVEFSNICRKRLPLTMIYQKLQKEFPNTKFNKTQLETIRQTLIANGIDVACGLCFVEDRRQHNDEIGQGFIDALSGKDVYVNANQQKAIDKLRESGDNYIPNLYELLTLDGMKKLRMEHPDVANAFIKYNNARGQQAGRLFQAYSAYHREILKFNNARVKKTNDVGGLRIFSFSDFEAHHLIDLVQVLTDCARKGIKVQGYTKVPEFALAVKDTGMKLNRSLIAKDNGVVEADYSPKMGEAVSPNVIDGKRLLLDTVEGIDVTDKNFFDSSTSKNVGNILVGVNDEQIRIAMLDPFVDYIIPFHTGLSADILKQKGISDWNNYKYEQIEKTIVDGKMVNAKTHVNIYTDVLSDDIKTEKQFVDRYLEVCKEKNLVPKFARFLNRDKAGDFVYAKGYYKFLLDFKMFDAKGRILPQEVVQPIFNDEVNKQILDDYVKGEKAKAPNEEVYEEVKEALGLGVQPKFSLITPEMDATYLDAVERGDIETAQRMVMEAAKLAMPNTKVVDEDGNPKVVYHGSNAQFTVFDTAKIGSTTGTADGRGFYFTTDKDYARGYVTPSGKLFGVFLNIDNPLSYDRKTITKAQLEKILKEADKVEFAQEGEHYMLSNYADYTVVGIDGAINEASNLEYGYADNDVELIGSLIGGSGSFELIMNAVQKVTGKSGMIAPKANDTTHYIVTNPSLIKFADPVTYDDAGNIIPLSERFNPEKEDIRYSLQTPSLLGVHNISLDKLRKAIKMGGLVNPSVAVINVDKQTHDDYGEYSLILPKNMVDARQGKNVGTWAGDAWTPTYPQVVKRMNDDKAISRFYKDIDALPEAIRGRVHLDFDSFMEGRSANALAYWYLFEKGNAPALVYMPSRYSEDITNAVEEATNGSFSMYGLTSEERAKCLDVYIAEKFNGDRAAFEEKMQARIGRLTEAIETKKSDRVKKWAQDTIDSIKEYGFDYDDVADFIRDVGYDGKEKGKVNVDATIMAAQERINKSNLAAEYDAWRDNLENRYGIEEFIFDGATNSGNRRYLPHTVENASKWMKKQGREGAVAIFPSFGVFIANAIPKMTTLESIRKRKALLGKSKEEYDAFREKWENVYYELGNKLQPDATSLDDYGYWRLIEAVGKNNPEGYIKKEYGIEMSEEDIAKFNDMVNAIRTEYPARYFETKFERPLQLSDFTAAVVPNDIPLDVESRLKDAGVEVIEYEKDDNASRAEAMQKASAVENVRFSLQTFDDKVQFIAHEANLLGVQSYVMVAENTAEYLSTLNNFGVVNPDRYKKSSGVYIEREDAIVLNGDYIFSEMETVKTLIHEHTHSITKGLKDKLEEVLNRVNEGDILAYRDEKLPSLYENDPAISVLNEIISFFVEDISYNKLVDFYHGVLDVEDLILSDFDIKVTKDERYWSLFEALMPIVAENLTKQKDYYNGENKKAVVNSREFYEENGRKTTSKRRIANGGQGRGYRSIEGQPRVSGHDSQVERREKQGEVKYALFDMPFFSDEGGDVIIFDDTAEAFTRDSRPVVTEDTLRSYIDGRHYAATQRIRKEAADMKAVARLRLQEERRRRSDGIASQRTNVGKVDYILGDTSRESLSYTDQALVMIAEGSVHILWGKDKNGRNGLAAELGYRDGDKKAFRQITQGATQSFEGFVHSWWEAIGGYESGVDTQDLRNALIEALSEASKASTALSILREKFDAPQREYDDAIADIEANVDRELALEDARYNDEVAEFEGGEDKAKLIRYYEQNAIFHDDLTSVAYTIRDLERKLERATREASKARARGNNNAETLRNLRGSIAEAREAIAQVVRDSKVLKYNRREVQAIVNSVESARTANALKVALGRIENLILNIRIREERNNMQRLLNMRLPNGQFVETWVGNQVREGKMTPTDAKRIMADMWRGVDSRGVKVAKFVDPHTQAVMTFLRNELVMPIAKKGVVNTENEDGTTTRAFTTEREATEPIDALRAANDVARAEVINNAASAGRSLTSQEQVELDARELYDHYLSIAEYKQQLIKNQEEIIALKELKRELDNSILEAEYSGALTEEARNHRASIIAQLGAVYASRMEIKRNYESRLMELNERIGNILAGGRDALKAFREGKEQHRQEVVNIALNAIGGAKALQNPNPPTAMQKVAAKVRGSVHDPYWTFETACREIDRWAPNGEGDFFNHFMGGYMEASNGFASRQVAHYTQLGDVIHRLWKEHRHKSAYNAFVEIMREADTHVVGTLVYNTKLDAEGMSHHPEKLELRISNAMFVIAMWRQKQYQATMAKYGITQERIDELEAAIERVDRRYIEFMNYINDVFLPDTRLEYDEVHKKMFGASMDAIENYFPAKVVRNYEEVDVANQVDGALPSTITRSIISRKAHGNQPDYTQSYFGMLLSHIQDMDHWASFAPLTEDINAVLSNSEFKKRLNEHMSGVNNDRTGKGSLYQIFRTRCAIAVDAFTPKTTIADEILRNATRYWAASNISWRFSTALKQLSAAPIFAAYALNPKCLAIWTKNIAVGVVPMMGLFEWANENSPSFRQRWATKNAGNEKLSQRMREIAHGVESRSKVGNVWESVNDFIHKLATEWGITPNAAVDAWVCATGMKTIYEFEISKATKGQREATEEEKQSAMRKAEIFMNTTQQSAESAYLSEVQMQKSLITTAITNYMNASYALHRLRVGGAQELGRGIFSRKYRRMVIDKYGEEALSENNKKAMARILQGVIGDVGFYLAGIGLKSMWALIAGVDDDEDEKGEDFTDMSLLEKAAFICKVPAQIALNGFLGGNLISNYLQGYEVSATTPMDALLKMVGEFIDVSENKDTGETEWAIDWWAGASLVTKFGFGVDLKTMLNIAEGVAEIDTAEGVMKIFNEPRSSINFVAGRRREGETVKQYVERRMHLEIIGSEPSFEDMFDEEGNYIGKGKIKTMFGLTDKQIKGSLKEYKERQARAVLDASDYAKYENIDAEYTEVCEKMGWKPEKDPKDPKVDKSADPSKNKTKKGMWIYPEGLKAHQYNRVKKAATLAADKSREVDRFIGTDEGYKQLLEQEYDLKSNVINVYNEL